MLHVHDMFWQAEPSAEPGQGAGTKLKRLEGDRLLLIEVLTAGANCISMCSNAASYSTEVVRSGSGGERKPVENPNTEESGETPGCNAAYHWLTRDFVFSIVPCEFHNTEADHE